MNAYSIFAIYVLIVCALAALWCLFDLVVGWITDGSTDHPGGTR